MLTALQTLYVTISFILGAVFLYRAVTRESWQSLAHTVIVSWSGTIYLTQISTAGSQGLPYYADWIITTPLIVLTLGYVVNDKITREVLFAASSQILTIFFAYLHVTTPSLQPQAMLTSLAFFLVTVFYLSAWLVDGEKQLLAWITLVTWFAYPAVYYAYDGLLGEATTALVILPLLSKHVFTSLKEFYY